MTRFVGSLHKLFATDSNKNIGEGESDCEQDFALAHYSSSELSESENSTKETPHMPVTLHQTWSGHNIATSFSQYWHC